MGSQSGYLRRTRDILSWAKKRRHHIRREDLVAFLCGKAPPVRHRGSTSLGRSASRVSVDRSSPRLPPATEPMEDQAEPDLQPFREALALQGTPLVKACLAASRRDRSLCRITVLPVTYVLVDTWMLTVKLVYELSNVPDDTIYTHFQGITNNIYGFGRPFFAPSFFTRPPMFLPVHIRFYLS